MFNHWTDAYDLLRDLLKIRTDASQTIVFHISIYYFHSPVKFVGGDCWPRGPMATGRTVEQSMEESSVEQMDISGSGSEASAPLPIRHPSGINAGPYKKQTYPMNSKRPEHLRMNLWRSARPTNIRTLLIPRLLPFCFFCFQRDL